MKFFFVAFLFLFLAIPSSFAASESASPKNAPFGSLRWTLSDASSCPVDYRIPSTSDWAMLSSSVSGKSNKAFLRKFAAGRSTLYFTADSVSAGGKVVAFNPKNGSFKLSRLPKKAKLLTRCVKDRDFLAELGVENGNFLDERNGLSYPVRVLGKKAWLGKNLAIDLNANGKAVSDTVSSKGCYLEDSQFCKNFGRYYTWQEARKVCPVGWHLPGDAEWRDFQKDLTKADWTNLGRGGLRSWDSYGDTSNSGFYWSSSSVAKGTARGWEFKGNTRFVDRDDFEPSTGMYVRCVADLQ
ncbi:MAG: FISUMP domain-containing protein [Fibrobacteraceae bacterium]